MNPLQHLLSVFLVMFLPLAGFSQDPLSSKEIELAADHPRPTYEHVEDIDAMASALRKSLAIKDKYSFSRGWWQWDRLRQKFVDNGRTSPNDLKILKAVFCALILDWHDKLKAKGDSDLFYIFFVTTAPGDKTKRNLGDRTLIRDYHGGGYHGGWGGAARMRIFQELANQNMLSPQEISQFKEIVHQSMTSKFLDFSRGSQTADNHSFGNGGGIAYAITLFPDCPQHAEAKAWIEKIWDKSLGEFGDWIEWNYYPYGPIFLHGMLDIAEATGRIQSDRRLIQTIGRKTLAFIHGNGVRGNPNSGARVREDLESLYRDPWNLGYFNVETSGRDGHYWYRMAQHFKSSQFLWAAEQVLLGGRPPSGEVPNAYQDAYNQRFGWFIRQGITPSVPRSRTSIGLLSPRKHRIPERIMLNRGREAGTPFAGFFLYDKKSAHLDNVAGHLYEYSVNGAKFLHTSGKYNNIGRGGGTGEESMDSLLVMRKKYVFPLHPDASGGEGDFRRMGPSKHDPSQLFCENNAAGDSFAQFAFKDYYGPGSTWKRQAILTHDGIFIVADEYVGGEKLKDQYNAGPVWHLAIGQEPAGSSKRNWFDAPALDHAWWQKDNKRVLLYFHPDPHGKTRFGSVQQSHSQDVQANRTTFAFRPIQAGKAERFLSVFIPHPEKSLPESIAATIHTELEPDGNFRITHDRLTVNVHPSGIWDVKRN